MARTKEQLNEYQREYRKRKRRERGLQKQGRNELSPEQKEISKQTRVEWEKKWIRAYNETEPAKKLLYSARNRAKRKGIYCDLVESDIVIPTHCPYLGIELCARATRGTPRTQVMSLDRIDPNKGYTKDNIEVMSWLANTMKNNATPEQLVLFARTVLSRYEDIGVGCRNPDVEQGPSV